MHSVCEIISLALRVTNLETSLAFYTKVWGLDLLQREANTARLRGAGIRSPLLTLTEASEAQLDYLTFAAPGKEAIDAIAANLKSLGYKITTGPGANFPEGNYGCATQDSDGRQIRLVGYPFTLLPTTKPGQPISLNHIVLNTVDLDANCDFYTKGLGFRVTDTLGYMPMKLLGCNHQHHCLALYGGAKRPFLNHIAYEIGDNETFMRKSGEIKKAGCKIIAGPGRHSAGGNVFSYFLDPDNFVIEITTDMEQIADRDAWIPRTWLSGEDQWGFGLPLGSEEMRKYTV